LMDLEEPQYVVFGRRLATMRALRWWEMGQDFMGRS